MIRSLYPSDLVQLKEIHEKYYKDKFSFPDFYENYLCVFTVIEDDKVIASGGVRTIAESVIITNKDCSTRDRRRALYELFQASMFTAKKYNFEHLHAFIQDEPWEKCLRKIGFHNTKGQALVIEVE